MTAGFCGAGGAWSKGTKQTDRYATCHKCGRTVKITPASRLPAHKPLPKP